MADNVIRDSSGAITGIMQGGQVVSIDTIRSQSSQQQSNLPPAASQNVQSPSAPPAQTNVTLTPVTFSHDAGGNVVTKAVVPTVQQPQGNLPAPFISTVQQQKPQNTVLTPVTFSHDAQGNVITKEVAALPAPFISSVKQQAPTQVKASGASVTPLSAEGAEAAMNAGLLAKPFVSTERTTPGQQTVKAAEQNPLLKLVETVPIVGAAVKAGEQVGGAIVDTLTGNAPIKATDVMSKGQAERLESVFQGYGQGTDITLSSLNFLTRVANPITAPSAILNPESNVVTPFKDLNQKTGLGAPDQEKSAALTEYKNSIVNQKNFAQSYDFDAASKSLASEKEKLELAANPLIASSESLKKEYSDIESLRMGLDTTSPSDVSAFNAKVSAYNIKSSALELSSNELQKQTDIYNQNAATFGERVSKIQGLNSDVKSTELAAFNIGALEVSNGKLVESSLVERPYGTFSDWSKGASEVELASLGLTRAQVLQGQVQYQNDPVGAFGYGVFKEAVLNPGDVVASTISGAQFAAVGGVAAETLKFVGAGSSILAPAARTALTIGESTIAKVATVGGMGALTYAGASKGFTASPSETAMNLGAAGVDLAAMGGGAYGFAKGSTVVRPTAGALSDVFNSGYERVKSIDLRGTADRIASIMGGTEQGIVLTNPASAPSIADSLSRIGSIVSPKISGIAEGVSKSASRINVQNVYTGLQDVGYKISRYDPLTTVDTIRTALIDTAPSKASSYLDKLSLKQEYTSPSKIVDVFDIKTRSAENPLSPTGTTVHVDIKSYSQLYETPMRLPFGELKPVGSPVVETLSADTLAGTYSFAKVGKNLPVETFEGAEYIVRSTDITPDKYIRGQERVFGSEQRTPEIGSAKQLSIWDRANELAIQKKTSPVEEYAKLVAEPTGYSTGSLAFGKVGDVTLGDVWAKGTVIKEAVKTQQIPANAIRDISPYIREIEKTTFGMEEGNLVETSTTKIERILATEPLEIGSDIGAPKTPFNKEFYGKSTGALEKAASTKLSTEAGVGAPEPTFKYDRSWGQPTGAIEAAAKIKLSTEAGVGKYGQPKISSPKSTAKPESEVSVKPAEGNIQGQYPYDINLAKVSEKVISGSGVIEQEATVSGAASRINKLLGTELPATGKVTIGKYHYITQGVLDRLATRGTTVGGDAGLPLQTGATGFGDSGIARSYLEIGQKKSGMITLGGEKPLPSKNPMENIWKYITSTTKAKTTPTERVAAERGAVAIQKPTEIVESPVSYAGVPAAESYVTRDTLQDLAGKMGAPAPSRPTSARYVDKESEYISKPASDLIASMIGTSPRSASMQQSAITPSVLSFTSSALSIRPESVVSTIGGSTRQESKQAQFVEPVVSQRQFQEVIPVSSVISKTAQEQLPSQISITVQTPVEIQIPKSIQTPIPVVDTIQHPFQGQIPGSRITQVPQNSITYPYGGKIPPLFPGLPSPSGGGGDGGVRDPFRKIQREVLYIGPRSYGPKRVSKKKRK